MSAESTALPGPLATSDATGPRLYLVRSEPDGAIIWVTSAQRAAAIAMVKRSLDTGRVISPSVRKIAEAEPAPDQSR